MNAISPSLSQSLARLSRPVPVAGEGGADECRSAQSGIRRSGPENRPDYIAAIEAALIAPVQRSESASAPTDKTYTGNANALVARLRPTRTPAPVAKAPAPVPRAPSPFALGPITVTLPPQGLATRPTNPSPSQSTPAMTAAERLLLALTAEDTFIFTR